MVTDLFGGYPGARFIGEEERDSVAQVIAAQSPYRFYGIAPQGKADALEAAMCHLTGSKYALAVSSGTAALHTALVALGVGPGDEVVLPAYGWSADVMAILACDAVPVIAPIDEGLGLDPATLPNALSEKTKAIIVIHMRGYPAQMQAIAEIATNAGVPVIEDCAQCLGGRVGDDLVGSMGAIGVYSFQYNKLVTGGEGGALVMKDLQHFETAARFHDLGMLRRVGEPDPEGRTAIAGFGLNYRISELQAAMVVPQLAKIPLILANLEKTLPKARQYLASICEEFGLQERLLGNDARPNNAFLCFMAETQEKAEGAIVKMRNEDIPAQSCNRLDPHHFEVWSEFLSTGGYTFRNLASGDGKSFQCLARSIFVELRSN